MMIIITIWEDDYKQPSYRHSQYDHNSYVNQVFQQDTQVRKRAPDPKEAAEGASEFKGIIEKRTCHFG